MQCSLFTAQTILVFPQMHFRARYLICDRLPFSTQTFRTVDFTEVGLVDDLLSKIGSIVFLQIDHGIV